MQVPLLQTQDLELDLAFDGLTGVVPGRVSLDVLELCQTDMVYDRSTPLAAVQAGIATFTGYASGVITWGAPTVDANGEVEVIGTVPIFRPTDSVTPNSIFGCYITNAAKSKLHFLARLANPGSIPMGGALNALLLTVRWRVGKPGNAVEVVF